MKIKSKFRKLKAKIKFYLFYNQNQEKELRHQMTIKI